MKMTISPIKKVKIGPKTSDCIFMVMHITVLLIDFLPMS